MREQRDHASLHYIYFIFEFKVHVKSLISIQTQFDERLKNIMSLKRIIPANFTAYNNDNILCTTKVYETDFHTNASMSIYFYLRLTNYVEKPIEKWYFQ